MIPEDDVGIGDRGMVLIGDPSGNLCGGLGLQHLREEADPEDHGENLAF
jgi:hypothetical protein